MSRLKRLLRVAGVSTETMQQRPVQPCKGVAHHLHTVQQRPIDERMGKVIDKLKSASALRYAMDVHIDADPEAVILTLAIRGKGACELRIPKSRYDAFALLELIEQHTARETLQ